MSFELKSFNASYLCFSVPDSKTPLLPMLPMKATVRRFLFGQKVLRCRWRRKFSPWIQSFLPKARLAFNHFFVRLELLCHEDAFFARTGGGHHGQITKRMRSIHFLYEDRNWRVKGLKYRWNNKLTFHNGAKWQNEEKTLTFTVIKKH